MKIVITGANGFIGSSLFEHYRKNNDLVLIDKEFTNLQRYKNVKYIECDLVNGVQNAPKDFDVFIHCAAICGVPHFANDNYTSGLINSLIDLNVYSFLSSLEYTKPVNILYFSTSEVYGENENCTVFDKLQIDSTSRGHYASAKLNGEFMFKGLNTIDEHIRVNIVRPFNIIGPNQTSKHGHIIPTFIENARASKPIEVHFGGAEQRLYCPIEDAIRELDYIISFKGSSTFNLASNEPSNFISVQELATLINDLTQEFYTANDTKVKPSVIKHVETDRSPLAIRKPSIDNLYPKNYQPRIKLKEYLIELIKKGSAVKPTL